MSAGRRSRVLGASDPWRLRRSVSSCGRRLQRLLRGLLRSRGPGYTDARSPRRDGRDRSSGNGRRGTPKPGGGGADQPGRSGGHTLPLLLRTFAARPAPPDGRRTNVRKVTIDPVTRIEGHGRVEIFLDDSGEVSSAYFVVPELRGFEQLCVGRPVEEMPSLTSRVCGLCPEAHHLASAKALDTLFGVEPPPAARAVRELLYMAFVVSNHATHFFALAGP
ncbi:MAG: nickel-dependent hydrogenase large subunit, partial [Acidobacteria bacterium]|nr:nickel-dependent hydrogenase large subunit [Acidobacteriota bacterium]